jgi:hypothetical protein
MARPELTVKLQIAAAFVVPLLAVALWLNAKGFW